ncbi:proteasome subunit beta type-7 [Bombina bombina]|uniref:proteasome subunit beta type-7 n=1 Tax=Bombina bombina TaxID=8345 RepID=UPI00235A7631|nr:proteasome subunit beta type-7 [Bombina bombina]XP_053577971.1 proteasome subunit beta type-7 [Bombina bombina]
MLPTLSVSQLPQGGFSFENCLRNSNLEDQGLTIGLKAPKARKTGTTIAGLIFKDGVILGADRRATDDMVVADKNCAKIHYITENIYCCGAGVAADAENVTQMLSSNLHLHSLSTGRQARVCTANRILKQLLYRYQGHIGASLIVGGVDVKGPHLYSIYPHGSTDAIPFAALGSGASAAMAVLEDRFKPNMELEDAKQLVTESITAGILCDLGSGSGVDLCVIAKEGTTILRGYTDTEKRGKKMGSYRYKRGTTAVMTESITKLELVEETIQHMDVDDTR